MLNAIQSFKEDKVSLDRAQRRISMHPDKLRIAIDILLNIFLTPCQSPDAGAGPLNSPEQER